MATQIGCYWVRTGFSASSVAGALAFHPPQPALYKFERLSSTGSVLVNSDDNSDFDKSPPSPKRFRSWSYLSCISPAATSVLIERKHRNEMQAEDRYDIDRRDDIMNVCYRLILHPRIQLNCSLDRTECLKLHNEKCKSYIAVAIFRVLEPRYTMIFSHSNATDIGGMIHLARTISDTSNINVVLYDYSGYGESGGIPSETHTYYDIETVYKYTLMHIVGHRPNDIIICGQSIGSGPSCHLCAKVKVAGLVLHCPFTSGLGIYNISSPIDIYPNLKNIKKVKCPVMIVHGLEDREIQVTHGIRIQDAVPHEFQRKPYFVRDCGHSDIFRGPDKIGEYSARLHNFFNSLDENDG